MNEFSVFKVRALRPMVLISVTPGEFEISSSLRPDPAAVWSAVAAGSASMSSPGVLMSEKVGTSPLAKTTEARKLYASNRDRPGNGGHGKESR